METLRVTKHENWGNAKIPEGLSELLPALGFLLFCVVLIVPCVTIILWEEHKGPAIGTEIVTATVTIDGCQYLATRQTLIHKGNCTNHPHALLEAQ